MTVYLHHVAKAMAKLEAAVRAAELRSDRLERDLRESQVMSENGFHQLAATSTLAQAGETHGSGAVDTAEADRILDAAADHAARLSGRAEAALENVLAATVAIEADQERLIAEALADRDLLMSHARTNADEIVETAKELAAATRSDAQRFAEELRELTATETIELVGYAKEMATAILESAGRDEVAVMVEDDTVTVDLRDPAPEADPVVDPAEGLGRGRPSRYEARSANLPTIGEDQASEAIDSIESLRDRLGEA